MHLSHLNNFALCRYSTNQNAFDIHICNNQLSDLNGIQPIKMHLTYTLSNNQLSDLIVI